MANEEAKAERQRLRASREQLRVATASRKRQHDDTEADLASHAEDDLISHPSSPGPPS
jgi:hypothetical protein